MNTEQVTRDQKRNTAQHFNCSMERCSSQEEARPAPHCHTGLTNSPSCAILESAWGWLGPGGFPGLQNRWRVAQSEPRWVRLPSTPAVFHDFRNQGGCSALRYTRQHGARLPSMSLVSRSNGLPRASQSPQDGGASNPPTASSPRPRGHPMRHQDWKRRAQQASFPRSQSRPVHGGLSDDYLSSGVS